MYPFPSNLPISAIYQVLLYSRVCFCALVLYVHLNSATESQCNFKHSNFIAFLKSDRPYYVSWKLPWLFWIFYSLLSNLFIVVYNTYKNVHKLQVSQKQTNHYKVNTLDNPTQVSTLPAPKAHPSCDCSPRTSGCCLYASLCGFPTQYIVQINPFTKVVS